MTKLAHQGNRRILALCQSAAILSLLLLLPFLCMPAQAAGEVVAGQSETQPVAKPHEKLECKDCHKSHSMVPPEENSRPCLKCHKDQTGKDSHPTGVAHDGEPPEGLPLSKDHKLTCNTCHILHESESPAPALLRKKFNDLCRTCHYPRKKPGANTSAPE